MSFITDKQTLEDLNILGKYKPNSIFSLFNNVKTKGGEGLLQEMFRYPLTDHIVINARTKLFKYFHAHIQQFPFQSGAVEEMENYLGMGTGTNYISSLIRFAYKKMLSTFLRDEAYEITHAGILQTIKILNNYRGFFKEQGAEDSPYALEKQEIITILSDPRFQLLSVEKDTKELSLWKASRYDYLLKTKLQHHMDRLLETIYQLDVYLAVSEVARTNDFEYAVAQSNTIPVFQTSGLRHPGLRKGVLNPLHFSRQRNLMFLTGANMAGKSTFMKSCGIAVYLAHMGFPVAAREMVFSVCEGLYSSINVSDDLNMGHSHFYAEVLRVKKVAEEVSSGKNLIVLFDELFKGTNVKDAYDGTLAVTAAFSKYRNCFFIVSTHITEVGEALKEHYNNMQMTYLPTVMEGNIPRYTYQLTEGITSDRQGMTIIQNEGILEIIRSVDQHQIKE